MDWFLCDRDQELSELEGYRWYLKEEGSSWNRNVLIPDDFDLGTYSGKIFFIIYNNFCH